MRVYIRKLYPDVRHRADIVKSLWEFVTEVAEKYNAGIDWVIPEPKGKGKKKRKTRQEEEEDEDAEEEEHTSKRSGTKSRKKKT